LICHICDDCLAKLAEFLEVNILWVKQICSENYLI
jgi:hypothetical protein